MALSPHPASSSSMASAIGSLRFDLPPNAIGPGMNLHSGSNIWGLVHQIGSPSLTLCSKRSWLDFWYRKGSKPKSLLRQPQLLGDGVLLLAGDAYRLLLCHQFASVDYFLVANIKPMRQLVRMGLRGLDNGQESGWYEISELQLVFPRCVPEGVGRLLARDYIIHASALLEIFVEEPVAGLALTIVE